MVKDVRLCLEEMKGMGLSMEVAEAVGRLWETVIKEMGPDSDFTSAIKPIEKAAGVEVRGRPRARHWEIEGDAHERHLRNLSPSNMPITARAPPR